MENYKVNKCLVCGFDTNLEDVDEVYCSDCGAPLINRCSNYSCNASLIPEAAHCKYCGSKSVFANIGIIKSKSLISNDFNDDIPF